MFNAIWASPLHSASTDADPHHRRCPQGLRSWCFYNRALADGQEPPPHEGNLGTVLSRDVLRGIQHVYRRMSADYLLDKLSHGKTQNANESLHHLIWVHCPKEHFVGKRRLMSAVAEAASKFNRGNMHVAQVMRHLNLPLVQETLSALE